MNFGRIVPGGKPISTYCVFAVWIEVFVREKQWNRTKSSSLYVFHWVSILYNIWNTLINFAASYRNDKRANLLCSPTSINTITMKMMYRVNWSRLHYGRSISCPIKAQFRACLRYGTEFGCRTIFVESQQLQLQRGNKRVFKLGLWKIVSHELKIPANTGHMSKVIKYTIWILWNSFISYYEIASSS